MFRGQRVAFKDWAGLNTFGDAENLDPNVWRDSNNILVGPSGSAVVLRSPLAYTNTISSRERILGIFQANYSGGKVLFFDSYDDGGDATYTYSSAITGGAATSRDSRNGLIHWKRLFLNNAVYEIALNAASGVNPGTFRQILSNFDVRDVGITPPSSAPTLSFVAGGTGSFATGVTVSYAYRNSATGHVSAPSPPSTTSGPSTNSTLRVAVTASAQSGVDGIIFFITLDGGSVRYLMVESDGDIVVEANTTGNVDLEISDIFRDTLTPETTHNRVPPTDSTFMFAWKDRIFLLKNTSPLIQYSGYESVVYGVPYESWPARNFIRLPNENDKAVGGIATQVGALILGEVDSYLISGYPPDRVSGPQATLAVSEHIEPLNWGIGTKSPFSLVSTPFGEIWLDQDRRLMLWDHTSSPIEIGLPIRDQLKTLTNTSNDSALYFAQGEWVGYGETGGTYILTASDTSSASGKMFLITLSRDPESGKPRSSCAVSDIHPRCVSVIYPDGTDAAKVLIGTYGTDETRLFQILDPDVEGSGWNAETRFFEFTIGNESEFAYFHSLRFDGSTTGLIINVTDMAGSVTTTLTTEQPTGSGNANYALIDRYGHRLRVKFSFSSTDTSRREIKNFRVFYKPSGRQI